VEAETILLGGSDHRPFVNVASTFIGNYESPSHYLLAGVRAVEHAVVIIAGIGIGRTSVHFLK
jgi:hypothetical protein